MAIIISSYILEDLAIISAAILAADQMISVPVAATAIMLGIISGDIGLYGIGYFSRSNTWLKKRLPAEAGQNRYLSLFNHQLLKNILLIRFIPGLRFICYTSCGLFRVHFRHYLVGVSLATSLWVLCVFSTIYLLGSSAWAEHSQLKWLIAPIALLMLYLVNRRYMQHLKHSG